MKHTLLFDMDGVLIDSQPVHFQADLDTLAHFGAKVTLEEIIPFAGTTNPLRFPRYRQQFAIKATAEEMMAYRAKRVRELFVQNHCCAIEGVQEVLEEGKQMGWSIGLASSTERSLILWILEQIGLKSYFEAIISGEEVAHSKPAPDVFLAAAKALKAAPEQCLVIEDSANGVLAGKRAGMKVLGYQNPTSGPQDLSLADRVVTDFITAKLWIFSEVL
ncbi:MAG TPA: HAD-IA family hydrolase [Firmicutes bacterium]|nr:HAD-IA family hydrolase [Bacillota bacterium]